MYFIVCIMHAIKVIYFNVSILFYSVLFKLFHKFLFNVKIPLPIIILVINTKLDLYTKYYYLNLNQYKKKVN